MGWFGGRLFKRGRSHRPGQGPADEERRGRKPSPSGTLVLLTPDAAGAACFRLHAFPDADSAAAFLQTWYAGGVDRATAAFWAMHQEPAPIPSAPQAPAEPAAADETPPQTDEQELRDVFDELMRTLRSGWEQQDGPFQGFGSPPGKF